MTATVFGGSGSPRRHRRRGTLGDTLVVLHAPIAAIALLVGGCIVPPVVIPSGSEGFTLGTSAYPLGCDIVEVPRRPDRVLRGLWLPSDEGAPIVVHFAESGGSISNSVAARNQYEALMHAGFASLAVDYGGIGLSSGEVSTAEFVEDVRAIYAHARERVEGDESRLLLRGTSLGTVAIATLLEDGAQPSAVVLHAPVFARTVATRYGYATLFDPLVWMIKPFLKTWARADLYDVLRGASMPVFVMTHGSDELLGETDHDRLAALAETRASLSVTPPRQRGIFTVDGVAETRQLKNHIGLSMESFHIGMQEAEFLREALPEVPPVSRRTDRVLAAASRPAVEALYDAGPQAHERMEAIVAQNLGLPPSLVVAASVELEDPTSVTDWLRADWGYRRYGAHPFAGRSFEELRQIFDLSDPTGPLDPMAVNALANHLPYWEGPDGRSPWPVGDLLAAANASFGVVDGQRVFPEGEAPDRPGMFFEVRDKDAVHVMRKNIDGTESARWLHLAQAGAVPSERARPRSDQHRRLTRALLKACGHGHEVVEDARGRLALRVRVDGEERLVTFDG